LFLEYKVCEKGVKMSDIDYGPLSGLIGSWTGEQGQDLSPEPDGTEHNAYTETITFSPAGETDNAETQELVALHYHLAVHRIPDGKAIHNQTGYWIWDSAAQIVMHSFTIPRAVCVIAGGGYSGEIDADAAIVLEVSASLVDSDWPIIQSPFLRKNAITTDFRQRLTIGAERLSYQQTTLVDIYGRKSFEHTDENVLQRRV
jgi:hypothetical protein